MGFTPLLIFFNSEYSKSFLFLTTHPGINPGLPDQRAEWELKDVCPGWQKKFCHVEFFLKFSLVSLVLFLYQQLSAFLELAFSL